MEEKQGLLQLTYYLHTFHENHVECRKIVRPLNEITLGYTSFDNTKRQFTEERF